MSNVIEFEGFKVTRVNRRYAPGACKHFHFTIDENGGSVVCDDCAQPLSPTWALALLCDGYNRALQQMKVEQTKAANAAKTHLHLTAAKVVESAWRSRSMVPVCPHCRAAIFPEDQFGRSTTNRAIAVRRRQVERAATTREGQEP